MADRNPRIVIALYFALSLSILSNTALNIYSQTDIESAKTRLEELSRQLEEIDAKQRKELTTRETGEKGEFETTEQYEQRSNRTQKEWMSLYNEIDNQQGRERETIYKEINSILSREFAGRFKANLGTYDADRQVFPVQFEGGFQNSIYVPLEIARDFKENFDAAEKTGVIGVVLDVRNRAKEYLITGKIRFREKIYSLSNPGFDNSRAMRMLFGNYDETTKYSAWRLFIQKFYVDGSDEDVYVPSVVYAKILTVGSYSDQGVEKKVLVTETAPTLEDNSCHACSVYISVAVFSKRNGYWKLDQAQKNTGRYGSFGQAPTPKIAMIGKNKYALKYDSFYMSTGSAVGSETYLTIDGGIFNEIFHVMTLEDNTGAMGPTKDQVNTKSKVVFKPSNTSDYFDAHVTTVGTKGKKIGKRYVLSPFSKLAVFKFSDGKYRTGNENLDQ